ncbi:MAG: retroviral-like aspartic protease family protein [Chloroflexi bacterium]|nr:retroviral-like aspartic protease family protein [Chloroflexota bacterium]
MNVLTNQCAISQAWAPTSGDPQPAMMPFLAIWDTGATNSVITQAVVEACGLVATGMATVKHVGGESQAETYLVNILLPSNVGFYGVRVTKGELPSGANILIGMNIINQGDFAVTNFNGITKFSFRVPSVGHIDFTEEIARPRFQHGGSPKPKRPKSPNPRGRGKKGKKKR